MSLTDDRWIRSSALISARKLHALGVVTYRWNVCEDRLFTLFVICSGIGEKAAWVLMREAGDVTLAKRTEEMALLTLMAEGKEEYLEAIKYALKLYDISRQNRNQLTHFRLANDARAFYFQRRSKSKPEP